MDINDHDLIQERKQKVLSFIKSKKYVPMKASEIAVILGVPLRERSLLLEILDKLESEGNIVKNNKNNYAIPDKDMIRGTFIANSKGYGFVSVSDEKTSSDIFIRAENINSAIHKDYVLCRVIKSKSSGEPDSGEVISVLKRSYTKIVGVLIRYDDYCIVMPDNKRLFKRIYIELENSMNAENNSKVNVSIEDTPYSEKNLFGTVVEILGVAGDSKAEALSILYQYDIPHEFPYDVLSEAFMIPDELLEEDYANRVDLRDILMVTIDNEDSKDLDDAVSLIKRDDGSFILGVHIADVSHYVPLNSMLDLEALKRGSSTYLVDMVIPMLPHKLSNGICSLNAGSDRLALSCIMEIDKDGNVVSNEIVESVINVDKKMSYGAVSAILELDNVDFIPEYEIFVQLFKIMEELASILNHKRILRGAIEFESRECKITLDENENVLDVVPYYKNIASRIIEEFMLVCNETVASEYYWLNLPFIFRNHEKPDQDKLNYFSKVMSSFGYDLDDIKDIKPIQQLFNESKGTPQHYLIMQLILRTMKQAYYGSNCIGHFGLATECYCHFTSPIRRYPDLQIHRIVKEHLNIGKVIKSDLQLKIVDICKKCSQRERVCEEAERDFYKLKKAEFMLNKLSRVFVGIISSVTSRGIYITLANTIEGFASFDDMNDNFTCDAQQVYCVGTLTKKLYHLGDFVKVKVSSVDISNKTISFTII